MPSHNFGARMNTWTTDGGAPVDDEPRPTTRRDVRGRTPPREPAATGNRTVQYPLSSPTPGGG